MNQAPAMPMTPIRRQTRHFPERLDFVGIGAPKCGTTWLARRLMDHPQVIMTGERAIFTPGFHLAPINPEHNWETVAASLGQRKDPTRSLLGTYYNEYLYSSYALKFLPRRFPQAKVYVVLRNPMARAISHYLHHLVWTQDIGPHRGFVDALAMPDLGILECGFYDIHLRPWLEAFPPGQVAVFIYEDLKDDPQEFLLAVAAWLGLPSTIAPPRLATRGKNANAISAVGVEEATLDFLEETYADTISYVSALLGRDLSGLWSRRIPRAQPGAIITPQQIKLARALILHDNRNPDLALPLLMELYQARAPLPQVYSTLAEVYRMLGQEDQARRVLENQPAP